MSDLYKSRDIVFEKLKARFSYLSNVNLSDADDPEEEVKRMDFPEKDIIESGLSKAAFWESLISKRSYRKKVRSLKMTKNMIQSRP